MVAWYVGAYASPNTTSNSAKKIGNVKKQADSLYRLITDSEILFADHGEITSFLLDEEDAFFGILHTEDVSDEIAER